MVETDVTNQQSEPELDKNSKYYKGNDMEEAASMYDAANDASVTEEFLKAARKREIKSDVISAVLNIGTTAFPMIVNKIRSKNESVPYNPSTGEIARLGVLNIVPVLKAVDTAFLGRKIQNSMETRWGFGLNDVRNITNLVAFYKPVHGLVHSMLDNVSREQTGVQPVAPSGDLKTTAWITGLNLVAPYIVYKFTDKNLTFQQKLSSIMPLSMFGGAIKKFASTNPKLQQALDVSTAVVKIASVGNNTLSNAVRPTQGSAFNKASNTLGGMLDVAGDLLGMNRTGIRNDYWYGNNGGSRFNGGFGSF